MTETNGPYFALLRLFRRRGTSQNNTPEGIAAEAYLGSIGIFIVTFLAGLPFVLGHLSAWQSIAAGISLIFAVWIFWLAVFYFNWIAIRLLRSCGLWRQTENRHAQNILIGLVVAALAFQMSVSSSWVRWIGIIALAALGANLLAALFLKFTRQY